MPNKQTQILRRLFALAWDYRRDSVVVLLCQVLLLALGLLGLTLVGTGVDVIRHALDEHAPLPRMVLGLPLPAGGRPLPVVLVLSTLVLVLAAIRSVLNYSYALVVGRLLQMGLVPRIRGIVFEKLLRLDFRFFDAQASGSIINRVTGDVQAVRSFLDGVLIQGIILILSLGVYIVFMASKHAGLTFACLATTPFLWVATAFFSRRMQPAYSENRGLMDDLVLALSEGVQGISVLRGFGREDWSLDRFRQKTDAVRKQQARIFRSVSIYAPSVSLMGQINVVVLLGFGGYLVRMGRLSLGDLIVFAGLLQQFAGQITNLATVVNTLQQSLIGARRVFEILDAPIAIFSPKDAVMPTDVKGAVRFEDVGFSYNHDDEVLSQINLDVPAGARVAIVGVTGSGKTTLLSLIPRFYDVTQGRVLIDGQDVRRFDLPALRRLIGIVFQETFVFTDTVAANIGFGHPDATPIQIEQAARLAQAHEFIVALPDGYQTRIGEGGAALSGGQRQRVALARALLPSPQILLLDDPSSALDSTTESEVLAALAHAMAGRTTFVIAHRLATVRAADLIVVMANGRIVQRGTHAELDREGGPYREALRAQLGDEGHEA